jgi:hypothetical protein
MRTMKLKSWMAKTPDGKTVEENILDALNALLVQLRDKEMPFGWENYQIFGELGEVFENARKTGILKIKDREYKFLSELIKKKIPARWGAMKELREELDKFFNLKDE